MTWKAHFQNDTDDPAVGTMTAVFTDPETEETFTYSRRFKDGEDLEAFASEAAQALAEHSEKKADDRGIALKVEAILNG